MYPVTIECQKDQSLACFRQFLFQLLFTSRYINLILVSFSSQVYNNCTYTSISVSVVLKILVSILNCSSFN